MKCDLCNGVTKCTNKSETLPDVTKRIYICMHCGNVFETIERKKSLEGYLNKEGHKFDKCKRSDRNNKT